jgi:hypothetical protein
MPAPQQPKPVVMRRSHAAVKYGVSESWLARQQREGNLTLVKINKAPNSPNFVRVDEMDALIEPVPPKPGIKPGQRKREKL